MEELGNEGTMMAIKCDLTDDGEVDAMFSQIMETWGGIDVCINNAAQGGPRKILGTRARPFSSFLLSSYDLSWRSAIVLCQVSGATGRRRVSVLGGLG